MNLKQEDSEAPVDQWRCESHRQINIHVTAIETLL